MRIVALAIVVGAIACQSDPGPHSAAASSRPLALDAFCGDVPDGGPGCVAGAICLRGICRTQCTLPEGDGGVCASGTTCHPYLELNGSRELWQGWPNGACVSPCDPVDQTGCPRGTQCELMRDSTGAFTACQQTIGSLPALAHCAVEELLVDAPVAWAGPKRTVGPDPCTAGTMCDEQFCKPIATAASGCASGFVADRATPDWSVCFPECDPLTGERLVDGTPDCGEVESGVPQLCRGGLRGSFCVREYYLPRAPHGWYVDGWHTLECEPLLVTLNWGPYGPNSYADPRCNALCAPGVTNVDAPGNAEGVAPHTCTAAGAAGAECRYVHLVDPQSPLANTLGVCINYDVRRWDDPSDDPAAPWVPWPSCTTLATTDVAPPNDGVPDDVMWGCAPRP